jgi:tetratricopeptide (TPR) repeat protein
MSDRGEERRSRGREGRKRAASRTVVGPSSDRPAAAPASGRAAGPASGRASGRAPSAHASSRVGAHQGLGRRGDALALLLLLAVSFLVYANALRGDFVYDDTKQIVGNDLIKEPQFYRQALTSDVWAFKGDKGAAWSNYWRPAFVLWLIANYRLFGLGSTLGWHLGNVFLHAAVVLLAFRLLRLLDVSTPVALAIGLLFAVHPAHVESVAWISGAQDLILSAALVAALGLLLAHLREPRPLRLGASLVLYGVALLSKEIGIFFPLIIFTAVFLTQGPHQDLRARVRRALLVIWPFLLLSAAYAAAHYIIIGRTQIDVPWKMAPAGILLTAPSLLFFYLRQSVFPWWMGPSYPLRAVTPANLGLENFWLPAAAVVLALWGLYVLSREHPVRRIGLVLFLVPLLPAMNINAFTPEQLVHDRYLYLPLLGLLMVLVPALADFLRARFRNDPGRAAQATVWAAALCALPLSFKTVQYNRVWMNEVDLWAAAVKTDPGSASNLTEYARLMIQAGRLTEAKPYLDRALSIQPVMTGYLQRADLAMAEKRYADAEADLKLVLADQPANTAAYERLTVCYQEEGRLQAAEELLKTARVKAPHMKVAFTDSLAIVLYLQNRKAEALSELESVRSLAPREYGSNGRNAVFHLGSLYAEMGRQGEARAALEEFLALTIDDTDPPTQGLRAQARAVLAKLGG